MAPPSGKSRWVRLKITTMAASTPRAQYRFELTVDEVLADREISWPLTPCHVFAIGRWCGGGHFVLRGGAGPFFARSARTRREGAPPASCRVGDTRSLDDPGLSRIAADKAYARTGLTPQDIDLIEFAHKTPPPFVKSTKLEMLAPMPRRTRRALGASRAKPPWAGACR